MAETSNIEWEKDPLYFIFNDEIPGKVKMHTRRLDLDNWIKIDKTYIDQMNIKPEILRQYRDEIFVTNFDESTLECKWELFYMIVEYLPKRFPSIFEINHEEDIIYNKALNRSISLRREDKEDPLIRASELTQEDWCILEWNEKEQAYVLTAAVVYFPMRWSLQEKFNQPLAGIHVPVEPFTKHLVKKVYDLFQKMPPEAPVWRANWAVFNDLKDPLDLYTPTGSLDRNDVNKTSVFNGEETGKELTFRAEYQTLRKLPKTKCIVFSIRTYQRYLEEFHNFPTSDVEGLVKAIKTLDPGFSIYKGSEFWRDAATDYLNDIIEKRNKSMFSGNIKTMLPIAIFGVVLAFGVFKLSRKILSN